MELFYTVTSSTHLMLILILFICDSQCMDMLILLICYVTCAGYEFKKVLDQMADGVKIIFMIDACYGGGFIELAHHKVVLFTSSKRDEESVRGSLGSVFTNAFVDCVNDYPGITHDELIQRIQILYGQHGSKPLPDLYATDEIKNSIFIL